VIIFLIALTHVREYFQSRVNALLTHILCVYIFQVGVNQQLRWSSMLMLNAVMALLWKFT